MLDYVTTILSAPPSYDLVTLSAVKFELDITDSKLDAWLQTKVSNMSAAVQDYCDRSFVAQTIQDVIYFPHSHPRGAIRAGVQPLQLSVFPIQSVISVVIQEVNATNTLEPDDYVVDSAKGQLLRIRESTGQQGLWRGNTTTVQYVGGFQSTPLTVVEAVLKMVTKAYWKRGQDPALKSITQQSGHKEFWISRGSEGNMTPDIQDLLDNYRMPVIG